MRLPGDLTISLAARLRPFCLPLYCDQNEVKRSKYKVPRFFVCNDRIIFLDIRAKFARRNSFTLTTSNDILNMCMKRYHARTLNVNDATPYLNIPRKLSCTTSKFMVIRKSKQISLVLTCSTVSQLLYYIILYTELVRVLDKANEKFGGSAKFRENPLPKRKRYLRLLFSQKRSLKLSTPYWYLLVRIGSINLVLLDSRVLEYYSISKFDFWLKHGTTLFWAFMDGRFW